MKATWDLLGGEEDQKKKNKTPDVKPSGASGSGKAAESAAAQAKQAQIIEHHEKQWEEELERQWNEEEEETPVEVDAEEDDPWYGEDEKAAHSTKKQAAKVEVEDEDDDPWYMDEDEKASKPAKNKKGKTEKSAAAKAHQAKIMDHHEKQWEEELERYWNEDEEKRSVGEEAEAGGDDLTDIREMEDIKAELDYWWKRQMDISSQHFAESNVRRSKRDEEELERLKEEMETARENYRRVEQEYRDHPGYYEDAYRYTSGFEKAAQGIVNELVATVPMIGQVLGNEWQTFKRYFEDDSEDKPRFFDGKLDGKLSALDEYREPIDMDSGAMKLMEEAYWLQESGSDTFGGGLVNVADGALGFWWPYAILSVARNAAENTYEQGVQGKTAGEALNVGALSAVGDVLLEMLPMDDLFRAVDFGKTQKTKDILQLVLDAVGRGTASYGLDMILDRVAGDEETGSAGEWVQSVLSAFGEAVLGKKNKKGRK